MVCIKVVAMTTVKEELRVLFSHVRAGILPAGEVNGMMQKYYPGEYTIKECYDHERMCFCFKPVFKDAKKEMLWRIKHGY